MNMQAQCVRAHGTLYKNCTGLANQPSNTGREGAHEALS